MHFLRRVIQNMPTTTKNAADGNSISGVEVPNSKLAREATELVRDTEPSLLFNHSTRVYHFASLAGKRRKVQFNPELLYIAAMFHDMGLTPRYSSKSDRFEVDGAILPESSCASTISVNRRSILFGQRLHCTPRRKFHSTCIRWLRY